MLGKMLEDLALAETHYPVVVRLPDGSWVGVTGMRIDSEVKTIDIICRER